MNRRVPLLGTIGSICTDVSTGFTPRSSAYAADGNFIIKVGNLDGRGINWTPRERNFLLDEAASKIRMLRAQVQAGDILLTSSAHHVMYVGLKVDIVTSIPSWLAQPVFFSGEVMRLRCNSTLIDPVAMYLWLRSVDTRKKIQSLVRGMTAHLYADDVCRMGIDVQSVEHLFPTDKRREATSCIEAHQAIQGRWRALELDCGLSRSGDANE